VLSNINFNRIKYPNNAGFNKVKIIFPSLTPIETVEDRVLYMWHCLVLQCGNMFEVESVATCTETLLSCPYFAGTRLL
jgi:hypothetical protein